MKRKFARGFTLIELLVVVLIIGILASIAVPQYKLAVHKARLEAYLPTIRALAEAQERFEHIVERKKELLPPEGGKEMFGNPGQRALAAEGQA